MEKVPATSIKQCIIWLFFKWGRLIQTNRTNSQDKKDQLLFFLIEQNVFTQELLADEKNLIILLFGFQ